MELQPKMLPDGDLTSSLCEDTYQLLHQYRRIEYWLHAVSKENELTSSYLILHKANIICY